MNDLRMKYWEVSRNVLPGFLQVQKAIEEGPLDKTLLQFVYQRVSLINGCAFCLAKHAKELREAGESNERIDALSGWRASHLYSPRERVAFAWVDTVTRIEESAAPDAIFDALNAHFDSREIVDLTMAIAVMNAMNRIAIGMRQ